MEMFKRYQLNFAIARPKEFQRRTRNSFFSTQQEFPE